MRRCFDAGLVKGEHMSVDGSFIQANADHHSRVPREQLGEVAEVHRTVREYLAELEEENPVEPPVPRPARRFNQPFVNMTSVDLMISGTPSNWRKANSSN